MDCYIVANKYACDSDCEVRYPVGFKDVKHVLYMYSYKITN